METTGQFVSNGTEGTVEVQLKSGDNVVGSTTIEVRKPDSITFVNDEVNLGFEEETDLGLTVKWNNTDRLIMQMVILFGQLKM